jgi:Holliday junction resolvase
VAESSFQKKVKLWLKQKGCFVLVLSAYPGIPDGMPDILALIDGGGWIALECKASAKAKFRPLQKPTIDKLNRMFYAKAVYPENWEAVKRELEQII